MESVHFMILKPDLYSFIY